MKTQLAKRQGRHAVYTVRADSLEELSEAITYHESLGRACLPPTRDAAGAFVAKVIDNGSCQA